MAEYNSVNLGRIMPKYTGDYSTNINYNTLDIVFYEGNSYIAKQPSRNQEPKADSVYWGLSSSKGEKGDKGDKGDIGPKGDKGDTPDITVGGRNLLANSAFLNGFTGWNNENNSWTIDSSTYQGNPVIKSPTTTGSGIRIVQKITNPPASGSKVMVSFNARGNDSNSIIAITLYNGNVVNVPLTSSFSRYTVSFTIPRNFSVPQIYFWNLVAGNNVFLNSIKLEAGNVATDWTPALEDVPSNDSQLVHKSGDTMTGGLKGGQINLGDSGDLNELTDTGKYYQTVSWKTKNWSNRPSNAPNLAFSVDVIGQANQSLVTQVYYVHTTNRMWVRTMWLDGSMKTSDWAELANDNNVVHKTGNEVLAGDKTFTGKLVANNPITGTLSIDMLPQKDLNSATVTGKYKIDTTYLNTPSKMPNGAFIDVLNFDSSLIYQVIVARDISDTLHKSTMWVRMGFTGSWGDWQSISKDDNVLHNSGNETVAGDKTFTGSTKFSGGLKGGQTDLPASGDLNTLTDTGKYYQTTSVNTAKWLNRPSNAPSLAFSVDVIGQANKLLTTQVYYAHTTSRMWIRTMWLDGSMKTSEWTELANDANVVHNTGNETIAGDKTIIGDNTYMGSNTFMDGVSLNGKNEVNGLTDTDWLDIPLAEGRTGIAKYKVSLGKVFVHLDGVKGMSGVGLDNTASYIGNLPKGGSYYARYTTMFTNSVSSITCTPNGLIYLSGVNGNQPTVNDAIYTDFVVI